MSHRSAAGRAALFGTAVFACARAAGAAELSAGDTAWMLTSSALVLLMMHRSKPTVLGAATAAVAGLVAITPAYAFVTPIGSIWIGFGAAVICYAAVTFAKPRLGYDDSLDVFGVHGVGGTWGAIATGLFIAPFALPEDVTWISQVSKQLTSVAFTAIYAPLVTVVILFGLKAVLGNLRVTVEEEWGGIDLAEHSETAYTSQ